MSCFSCQFAIPPSLFARRIMLINLKPLSLALPFPLRSRVSYPADHSLHNTLNSVFPKQNSSLSPFSSLTKKRGGGAKKPVPLFVFPALVNHTAHLGNHPSLPFTFPFFLKKLHMLSSDTTHHHYLVSNLHQYSPSLQTQGSSLFHYQLHYSLFMVCKCASQSPNLIRKSDHISPYLKP